MFGRNFFVSIFLIVSVFIISASVAAQDLPKEIISLKGIDGVGVEIEEIDPDAQKDGLNGDELASTVTESLGGAGIKVLSKAELNGSVGAPSLFVNINTIKHSGGVYSFTVNIGLEQVVFLARNLDIKLEAPTWSIIGTGASLPEDLDSDVGKYVKILVDSFIEQYKLANTK
ncbi:MAG: hypothetical protein RIG61_08965 [Deltaproteobacteria bacterium]